MKNQDWFCEECKAMGNIKYDAGADVWSVIGIIHNSHNAESPNCNAPLKSIRVVNHAQEQKLESDIHRI